MTFLAVSAKATHILLIGHDPLDGRFVSEALTDIAEGSFIVECLARLADGIDRLRGGGIAAVVLDLSTADGQTKTALDQIWQAAPHVHRRSRRHWRRRCWP